MSRRFDAGHAAYLTLNGAIVAFLLLPIAVVIIFALNPTPYIAFPPVGVTLRWFVKFFTSAEFMNALSLSLRVAVAVVVLSTTIGALCALAIARGNLPGARLLTTLFLVVPGGETLPVVLLNYIRFDLDGAIAAASMVSIILALSAVLLLERIIGLRAYVRL